jgi:hypothetical protein
MSNAKGLGSSGDVVNTNRSHTRLSRQNADDRGRLIAIGGGFTEGAEESLARRSDENGIPERDKLIEVPQKLPVVVGGFSEPKAWIDPEPSGGDSSTKRRVDSRA